MKSLTWFPINDPGTCSGRHSWFGGTVVDKKKKKENPMVITWNSEYFAFPWWIQNIVSNVLFNTADEHSDDGHNGKKVYKIPQNLLKSHRWRFKICGLRLEKKNYLRNVVTYSWFLSNAK